MIDFDRLLVDEARKWVGVREAGWNKGKEVEEFQKAVDGKAQQEAWCMAFMFYCIKQVEKLSGRKSWLHPSEHCLTVWTKSPREARIAHPEIGSLCIWQYYNSKGVPTGSGHTGLVIDVISDNAFSTIEGNTGAGTGVVREGDGVYERRRRMAKIGSFRVMGFLRPFKQDDV